MILGIIILFFVYLCANGKNTKSILILILFFSSCTLDDLHRSTNTDNKFSESDSLKVFDLNDHALSLWHSAPDSMIIIAKRALAISDSVGFVSGQMQSMLNIGYGHYEKGDYTTAIAIFREVLDMCHQYPRPIYEMRGHGYMAMALMVIGIHKDALFHLYKQLVLSRKLNQKRAEAKCLHDFGMVYHRQLLYDKAISYYSKSLDIFQAIGDSTRIGFILGNLAHIRLDNKDYEQAKSLYIQSLQLSRKQKNKKGEAQALQSLGTVLMKQEKTNDAFTYLWEAKEILEKTEERTEYLRLLTNISECYGLERKSKESLRYALEAIDLANEQGDPFYKGVAAKLASEQYEHLGNYQSSLQFHKLWKQTQDELFSKENKEEIIRIEEKHKYEYQRALVQNKYDQQLKQRRNQLILFIVISIALIIILILAIRNLIHRRRINKALAYSHELIKEKNQLLLENNTFKNHLISIVAHDIRTPLTALRNILGLFDQSHLSSSQIQRLMIASYKEIDALNSSMDTLLLWAISQSNLKTIDRKPLSLSKVIQDTRTLFLQVAEAKDIDIIIETDGNNIVNADEEMIKIVLRNLLSNALKFTPRGKKVYISCQSINISDDVKITVKDDGVGMSREEVDHLFDKKLKTNEGTDNEKGMGLGMLLCKEYVEKHGSCLYVKSKPGEGTEFWFFLPIY